MFFVVDAQPAGNCLAGLVASTTRVSGARG
jgi:hypothetical protein